MTVPSHTSEGMVCGVRCLVMSFPSMDHWDKSGGQSSSSVVLVLDTPVCLCCGSFISFFFLVGGHCQYLWSCQSVSSMRGVTEQCTWHVILPTIMVFKKFIQWSVTSYLSGWNNACPSEPLGFLLIRSRLMIYRNPTHNNLYQRSPATQKYPQTEWLQYSGHQLGPEP
jgi:hypothetical protein